MIIILIDKLAPLITHGIFILNIIRRISFNKKIREDIFSNRLQCVIPNLKRDGAIFKTNSSLFSLNPNTISLKVDASNYPIVQFEIKSHVFKKDDLERIIDYRISQIQNACVYKESLDSSEERPFRFIDHFSLDGISLFLVKFFPISLIVYCLSFFIYCLHYAFSIGHFIKEKTQRINESSNDLLYSSILNQNLSNIDFFHQLKSSLIAGFFSGGWSFGFISILHLILFLWIHRLSHRVLQILAVEIMIFSCWYNPGLESYGMFLSILIWPVLSLVAVLFLFPKSSFYTKAF